MSQSNCGLDAVIIPVGLLLTVVSVLLLVSLWSGTQSAEAVVTNTLTDNSAVYPAGVISLTYDDGPDADSRAIARYLHEQHISATFDVVGNWGRLGTTGFATPGYENYLKE